MIYFIELLKGIFIGLGVIIGFSLILIWMIKNAQKSDEIQPDKLVKPFEDYLTRIKEEEHYEQIERIEGIISQLKKGEMSDDIDNFNIKKESALQISTEDGKTILRVQHTYRITGVDVSKPSGK